MESTESGTTTEKAFKAASADIYMAAIDTVCPLGIPVSCSLLVNRRKQLSKSFS